MTEEIKNNQSISDDEIDLIALAKTVWEGRKIIIRTVIIFGVLGIIIALATPNQFTASTTIVPQLSSQRSSLGGLSSLAAMAGFDLNMNLETSELSPYVYPQIVESVPFQVEIMKTPFTFSDVEKPVSLFEYYNEYKKGKEGFFSVIMKYTIGLPGVIMKAVKGKKEETVIFDNESKTIRLSKEEEAIRKMVEGSVTLEANDKEGYLILSATMHEAKLASDVAQKGQELLQRYITEFKIEKTSAQLKFIEERYNEKKKEFEKAQSNLAAFRDRNKNVTSALARTDEERLQNEYQLAFEVYSQLAQQLEQARIRVKEDTPVFAIVKPVTVPLERSKPNRKMIVLIWGFLGGVAGVGWIFGKQFLATIKTKWNEGERE